MKLYIKPINIITGILIGAVLVNKFGLNFVQSWHSAYNEIAVEYLKVFLGWPSIVLLILVVFFSKFYSAIDYFIRNMRVKYKNVEATSQQVKNIFPSDNYSSEEQEAEVIKLSRQDVQSIVENIERLQTTKIKQQETIKKLKELVIQLANRAEVFEFNYLNYILVPNTKHVLRDLYRIGKMSKDSFIHQIFVPATVTDKYSEQLAIHNALLVNGLIVESGLLIQVSEKGERYLKFTGLIR